MSGRVAVVTGGADGMAVREMTEERLVVIQR